jgi:hypothetical protein
MILRGKFHLQQHQKTLRNEFNQRGTNMIYLQNYKMLEQNFKDLNKWMVSQIYKSKDLIFEKCQGSPKLIYNVISTRIPADCSVKIDKLIQKFIWNFIGPRIVKMMLIMMNTIRGITYPDLKSYCTGLANADSEAVP